MPSTTSSDPVTQDRSQKAFKGGTSETLRNEIIYNIFANPCYCSAGPGSYCKIEAGAVLPLGWALPLQTRLNNEASGITVNLKTISIHNTKHFRPLNDNQLGHYLAGLIDGDGHFSNKQQLIIVFSSRDVSLAYYLKLRIGYGQIRKVKNKNAYLFIISNKDGLIKIINLINCKLRTLNKYSQVINNILSHHLYFNFKEEIEFNLNCNNDFYNHWLAGFSDADASFQIKIVNKPNRNKPEIRLNYQIDQKNNDILILIKEIFGGNIGYRKSQDTYYYGSTSFSSANKIVKYFDEYHLQSNKYINYLK